MMDSNSRIGQVHAEFETLVEDHRGLLYKVVNTYCFHPEDQRDLMQEIVAQLWRGFPRFDRQRQFSTWMYRIALNVAISYVRSHVRRTRHSVALDESVHDVADESTGPPEREEQVRLLQRFITTLDPFNHALLLLYLEGCTAREIAEVLGISESNVTTRISRLKRRIRAYLDPEGTH